MTEEFNLENLLLKTQYLFHLLKIFQHLFRGNSFDILKMIHMILRLKKLKNRRKLVTHFAFKERDTLGVHQCFDIKAKGKYIEG